MTSFVTELLLSPAGQPAKDDLKAEIVKLSKRIELAKNEVLETLNNLYGKFDGYFMESVDLHRRLNVATKEALAARSKLEEELRPKLGGLVSKYEDVTEEMEKTAVLLVLLKKLSDVHGYFQEAKRAEMQRDYAKAASCIDEAGKELLSVKYECEADVKILRVLKMEHLVQREKLIYNMNEIWNEHVIWSVQTGNDKGMKDAILAITFSTLETADIVEAMAILKHLCNNVKIFGRNLMKLIVKPVILFASTVTVELQGEARRLAIASQTGRGEPTDVFDNIRLVFSFLHDTFFNNSTDKEQSFINALGQFFGQQFCEDLTKDCVNPAIPGDSSDLEKYNQLVNGMCDLELYLQNIGFLNDKNTHILSYAKNVDILFANKRCQEILAQARDIMQQELHITVQMSLAKSSQLIVESEITETNFEHQPQIKCLEEFPECQVSKFVMDLIQLMNSILVEAENGAAACATRLYYITRHICDLFCNVVPIYHKENITMYPQQTAIHHNNCMYLAHSLLTLGHRHQRSLKLPANILVSYADFVVKLRKLGTESFMEQFRRQRQQLLEFLQEGGIFQNLDSNLDPKVDKAIRKCLHLLTSLKAIWSSVLPRSVYLKAIGTLTNSCVEEIVLSVVRQEDITENVASRLNTLFRTMENEIPNLFQVNDTQEFVLVQKYVQKWQRFTELKLMTVSNLHEIVNRWADGKGPLAVEFSVEEVKHMMRALFQNTDRRAAALAKIR